MGRKTTMAAKATLGGLLGSVFLAGGTYSGLCYYTIWNADQRVKTIDEEIADLGEALKQADKDIEINIQDIAAATKVEDVRLNLSKAQDQVKRLESDLRDYNAKLENEKHKIVARQEQKSLLQRIRVERVENAAIVRQALSLAQKEAMRTRAEFDPVKRLQIDKWLK